MLVADVNQDGSPDLVFEGYQPVPSVMLNDGKGNFGQAMPLALPASYNTSGALALGDFNGDGFPDVTTCVGISGTATSAVAVYLNDHTGHFTLSQTLPATNGCSGIAVADANKDGKADIVLTYGNMIGTWANPTADNAITTWFGDGTGHFGHPVTQAGVAVPRSDGSNGPCTLGGFGFSNGGVGSEDNGTPELVLFGACLGSTTGFFGDIYVARGDGTGRYSLTHLADTLGMPRQQPQIEDINSDGHPDVIFVTHSEGPHASWDDTLSFLANDGHGSFQLRIAESEGGYGGSGAQITSGTLADLNGDGIPDAIAGFMQTGILPLPSQTGIRILSGQADGTFKQRETWTLFQAGTYDVPGWVYAIVSADFDRNGKPDIAALANGPGGTKLYIYLNQGQ